MMSPLKISWKSLWAKPLTAGLNILLIAFGTAILTVLLLASRQISDKLENNAKNIDLVVGAKGSPLQLVLSSVYYIDFPTGNIPLKDAKALASNPLVRRAVPLALGDNYNGIRIVGSDSNFVALYDLKTAEGKLWSKDFEATIGADVAKNQNLKVGDTFSGAHGLTGNTDVHDHHPYRVVGILRHQNNVTDNLILTGVSSVWRMHDEEAEHEHEEHDHEAHSHEAHNHEHDEHEDHEHNSIKENEENRELTALLIQYRSPMSVAIFPRMVNETTNMQAASPAQESTRLFSLIGVGVDTLQWFAVLIMLIAAISVFVNLYNSLKERSYDLAIMRTLGASRTKLFIIVISEGIILTIAGTLIGMAVGHVAMEIIGGQQDSGQARLTGAVLLFSEFYLFVTGLAIGIFASIIPALHAYRSDISKILSKS